MHKLFRVNENSDMADMMKGSRLIIMCINS